MAKIRPRGKKYEYKWDDPYEPYKRDPKTGEYLLSEKTGRKIRNQRSLTFGTLEEAELFKKTQELKIAKGKYISPSDETLNHFADRFIYVYAPTNWGPTTYPGVVAMIHNHILSELGMLPIQSITSLTIETHMSNLRKKKVMGPKSFSKEEKEVPTLSDKTIRDIFDILRKMFAKAVEWNVIEESPVKMQRPRVKNQETRTAWTKSNIKTALANIEDEMLYDLVFMCFFCSTRSGETVGITRDAIDLDDGDFGSIMIDKTLKRVKDKSLKDLASKEIQFLFPKKVNTSTSTMVLKDPKNRASVRKVYLTQKGRERVMRRLQTVQMHKAYHGKDYHDYNLLFCFPNGDPIDTALFRKWFMKWQERSELGLPKICVHALRHTSITYKIYVSGGDIKNVGLQAGQNNVQTTEGYNHGFEENQRKLIQLTEADFWGDAHIVSDDIELDDGGKVPVPYIKQLFEERMGCEMESPEEFDTAIEYLIYVMDELQQKKSLPKKAPFLHQSA